MGSIPNMVTIHSQQTLTLMGKMGQIAQLIQDGRSDTLDTLIKASERQNRDEVYFLGKTYSMGDAKQILMFMQKEEQENEKHTIYRLKQPSK